MKNQVDFIIHFTMKSIVLILLASVLLTSCTDNKSDATSNYNSSVDTIYIENSSVDTIYIKNSSEDTFNGQTISTFIYKLKGNRELTGIALDVPEITQEVLDNDAILVYLKTKDTKSLIQVPGMGAGNDHTVRAYLGPGYVNLGFFHRLSGGQNSTGITKYAAVKVVIIKSTNTITRSKDW